MEEQRDVLIVRSMKPPFLEGDVHFTRQTEMVSTVKDPTSDKQKQIERNRYWDLQRTKLGKLMGLKQLKSGGTKDDIQTDEEVKWVWEACVSV